MRSQSGQNMVLQVPFQLPEVPQIPEIPNPTLQDETTPALPEGILKATNNNSQMGNYDQVEWPTLAYIHHNGS